MSQSNKINLLNQFDFSQIEQLDPSLNDSFRLVYEKVLNFHVRFSDGKSESKELSNDEPLRIRLFVHGDDLNPNFIKIECNCESDLFFHYQQIIDQQMFEQIRDQQELQVNFKDYVTICIKSLNKTEKESQNFAGLFTIYPESKGKIEIFQITEYKNVQLLCFDVEASTEEYIRQQITFRYGSLKSKLTQMEARLQDINEVLRLKNPSLLLQLKKANEPFSKK